MDGHDVRTGAADDPRTQQAAEQLHADSLDALRYAKAFMLVSIGDDGVPRVRCTFTKSMSLIETSRFARGCQQGAETVATECVEIIRATYRRLGQDEAA